MYSNETSWIPEAISEVPSEPVDPDDTTISSSNLGPRDSSEQQFTRSADYQPLDSSELELDRLTDGATVPGGNYGGPRNTNASLWLL